MKLTKSQIQNQARALGLDAIGTIPEIQARIDAHLLTLIEPPSNAKRRPRDTAVGPFMLGAALLSGLFD